ncbi:MAG TPA: DNA repair protein RecN [Solimonas sp.]|nr:DNA repair protein RecN [Solimonas sp.]
MLTHLQIKNLAIIDELELDFRRGYTTLTGETGAGKSILIDAIGLITGNRADAALVRSGQDKAEVSAEFSLDDASEAASWLAEQELRDEDEPGRCLVRRIVYAEGRTRAFVNGQPVNAGPLRELGERLIEIFGQSESQTLLRPDVQRGLVDGYGGYAPALESVREAAKAHAEVERQIERLRKAGDRDPAQLDYLRFQLQELEALGLAEGEIERIDIEHKRLANAGRLLQDGGQAQELLYGAEASLYDQLATTTGLLTGLVPLHEGFREALDLTESAQAQVREAADSLKRLLGKLDLDPEHLAQLETRLADIHDLARKHRIKPTELPERLASLQTELGGLEDAAGQLEKLEKQRDEALKVYRKAAGTLSTARRKAAKTFGEEVTAIVRQLGMANAQFLASIETDAEGRPRVAGDDEIRFDFSANPGQPPRALAKVASGGELSRVSLAVQVVGQQRSGAATMIFDEVDAGISGGVAEVVGQKLRELGAERQVMSVTHLAQVAAQGHQQLAIHKEVKAGQTYTRVRVLNDKERVEELARMQGGVEITSAALNHARDMLKRSSAKAAG